MHLTSSAFEPNQMIPSRYTCDAENESPPLTIVDPPAGVRSFALILHDSDAPKGDFVHWVLWNIPWHTKQLHPGVVPSGAVIGRTTAGHVRYDGPNPPSGIHHYHFTVSALDTMLDLPPGATRDELLEAMEGHELDRVTLMGLYERRSD